MYFKPPQNNHNDFYHPLNQVNEEIKTIDKKKAKDIYDKLKKGSEVEVDFGNAITRGGKPITLKVTSGHRVVGASKVGRIILVDKENPRGMKYKLFDRNGSVSLAQSDMGTILRDMKIVKEGVEELDEEKKKPISTRLGDAFDSGELEDRIKSMSGPARKSFTNLANSLVDFYHSMGDIHQVDGRQLEDKIDASPPRVRKMFAKLLDEDVQLDESRDDFDYLDIEAARQDAKLEAPKVVKTRQGFQVMVFSRKLRKHIPQGSPHRTKAAAEKDAKMFEDVQLDETNFRFPQPGEDYGEFGMSINDPDSFSGSGPSRSDLKKRSAEIERKFASVMRKHKRTKVGEVLDLLDKDGGTKLYKDSDIKQISKYLTKHKDNVRKVAHQMMIDVMQGDDYLAKKRIPVKEDVQLDEAEEVIVNFRFDNRSDAIAFGHQAKKQGLALRANEFESQGKQTSQLAVDGDKLISLYFDYGSKLKKLAKKYMGKYSTTDGDKKIDKMMREDVQFDEERGTKIKVMVKGDENVYERMTRALMYARLPGYEGATFNKRKGMTTYAFDAKKHTSAVRKKFAKIIQTHNGEFVQSIEEGFASDAQRRAAFASGYKAKGKKKNEEEEVEEGLRQAMSGPRETPAQKRKRQEKDNFDLYKKRQGRISALRGDKSSRQLTPKQQRDYLKRVNLDQIRAMEDVDMQNVTASQLRAIKEAKVYRTLNNLRKGEENG